MRALLSLLLVAGQAVAAPTPTGLIRFDHTFNQNLTRVAGDTSGAGSHAVGAEAAENMTRDQSFTGGVQLTEYEEPRPFGKPAQIADMLAAAEASVRGRSGSDRDHLLGAIAHLRTFGRIGIDEDLKRLKDDEIGLYLFPQDDPRNGHIWVHPRLRDMGVHVDADFLAATLIHEIAHQIDPGLGKNDTISGEVFAFQMVHAYLRHIDPSKHRLARLRRNLMEAGGGDPMRGHAIRYTATLDRLVGTRGDVSEIRAYARELYPEDSGKSHSRHPH